MKADLTSAADPVLLSDQSDLLLGSFDAAEISWRTWRKLSELFSFLPVVWNKILLRSVVFMDQLNVFSPSVAVCKRL